jgi:cyanophycinase-like exopeptidase
MKRYVTLLLALLIVLPGVALAGKTPGTSKIYFRVGAATDAVNIATQSGTVLMGGSTDVDEAFEWLCSRADGGDFLVIRATGTDAYNSYIDALCPGLNSVATLIIGSVTEANSTFVSDTIRDAEIVWIAGGDQSNYVNYWKGTAVQARLNEHIVAHQPIGGTSAGMAVLTQFIYSALGSQGATSTQTLADPYNKYMTFARDLVAISDLAYYISDTHFVTRDRMGRTLGFLCRVHAAGWTQTPRAIAVDEETALLIDDQGWGTIVATPDAATGNVYFIEGGAPEVCTRRTPLTYRGVIVRRLHAGDSRIDVAGWPQSGGTTYKVTAAAGVLTSDQLDGSAY